MTSEQAGLRRRMGRDVRRISSQHRQLDALYAMITGAIEKGSASKAQLAFLRFQDALDAHFSLEDELYFVTAHWSRERHRECLGRAGSRPLPVFARRNAYAGSGHIGCQGHGPKPVALLYGNAED